jgi:hypothetical protein
MYAWVKQLSTRAQAPLSGAATNLIRLIFGIDIFGRLETVHASTTGDFLHAGNYVFSCDGLTRKSGLCIKSGITGVAPEDCQKRKFPYQFMMGSGRLM